jgi:hypothetical protein
MPNVSDVNGTIGIGTTSPSSRYVVDMENTGADTSHFAYVAVRTTAASGYGAGYEIDSSSTANGKDYLLTSTGDLNGQAAAGGFMIFDRTASVSRFIITASGNIGIGTYTPATALQVVGDIRVGTTGTNGCIQGFGGTAISGTCSSDARLKRNIAPITGSLEKLARIQPVTYEWRQDEFPERHFGAGRMPGLIAQEVEKALPELVTTDDKGYKAVRYGEPLEMEMLQAIRELRSENESLKERVAQMEARLNRQAAR